MGVGVSEQHNVPRCGLRLRQALRLAFGRRLPATSRQWRGGGGIMGADSDVAASWCHTIPSVPRHNSRSEFRVPCTVTGPSTLCRHDVTMFRRPLLYSWVGATFVACEGF